MHQEAIAFTRRFDPGCRKTLGCNIGSSADNTAIQRGKTNTGNLNYGSTIISVIFSRCDYVNGKEPAAINITLNGNRWANPSLTAG